MILSHCLLLIQITGEFTKNKHAAFPYSLASKEDQTIFSQDSVPAGFTLSDPDHLPSFKIESLYIHLLARQKKKLSPFVILNASPQHQASILKSAKSKGKRKMDYVEVHSDDDSVRSEGGEEEGEEEEEEDEGGDADEDGVDDGDD